jgi:PII-like signaling protein
MIGSTHCIATRMVREAIMELSGPAKRLTVFVGEQDAYDHHSVALEVVHRAHAAGLAGATVIRGVEGYGASNHIHTSRLLSLSDDLPLCIIIVDRAEAPLRVLSANSKR